MEKINILTLTDKSKIKEIKLKYPQLFHSRAKEMIIEEYEDLMRLKNELHEARDRVRLLEEAFDKAKRDFEDKSTMFNIEFETYIKKHITEESGLAFGNLGNDLIGKQH